MPYKKFVFVNSYSFLLRVAVKIGLDSTRNSLLKLLLLGLLRVKGLADHFGRGHLAGAINNFRALPILSIISLIHILTQILHLLPNLLLKPILNLLLDALALLITQLLHFLLRALTRSL